MRRPRRHSRLFVLSAIATLAAAVAVVGMGAPAAYAGVTTQVPAPYVTTANASDPDVRPCYNNGVSGYCLYASQDLTNVHLGYSNDYAMNQTLGYFSTDGINWTPEGGLQGRPGVILQEQPSYYSWVTDNQTTTTDHLGAPTASLGPDGDYYLYVPDITDPSNNGQHTSSRVGVSISLDGPFGSFEFFGDVLSGDPNENTGYMSDPNVLLTEGNEEFMVYSTGDSNTCGRLAIGQLTANQTFMNTPKLIPISGTNVMGNCGSSGHPFMEAPALYYTPTWGLPGIAGPWVLLFAFQPTTTQPGCATGFGEPGTGNEDIGYAVADTLDFNNPHWAGFRYQGILMCGSSREFTAGGSLVPITSQVSGNNTLILVYHDGAGLNTQTNSHNRTLHAECLMYGDGRIAAGMRTGPTGTSGAVSQCLSGFDPNAFALMANKGLGNATPNGKLVTTVLPSGQLQANRIAVGPNEKFSFTTSTTGGHLIPGNFAESNTALYTASVCTAYANNLHVTSASSTSPLDANTSSIGNLQAYNVFFPGDGTMQITGNSGHGVTTQTNGTLLANGLNNTPPESYSVLHY